MVKSKKRLLIIDRNLMSTLNVANINSSTASFSLIGIYADMKNAYLSLPKSKPEMIVISLYKEDIPHIHMIKKIRYMSPGVKIMIQTELEDENVLFDVLTIGLAGLTELNDQWEVIERNLNEIENGRYPLSARVTGMLLEAFKVNMISDLSSRQIEILKLMSLGHTSSTIANKLSISPETAKTHKRNIYKKLKVNSKEEALSKAVDEKIILFL